MTRVLVGLCLLLLSTLHSPDVQAQHEHRHDHGDGQHILVADDFDAGTFVGPPPVAAKREASRSAQIDVIYEGFTPQAQAAFQYAVDIWEKHVSSAVTIRIRARWLELEENVLGSAGPPVIFSFQGSPFPQTWYPPALANAIAGNRVSAQQQIDIEASFSSSMQWYYGTDGRPPFGTFDLVTVVLHEIGHGLGFFGSFRVDDGDDSERDDCPGVGINYGCWGYSNQQGAMWPVVFDRFVMDDQRRQLINTQVYGNPSLSLGSALRSRSIEFVGDATLAISDGAPVNLYAPQTFEPASSIAHLDEETYPPGDINSLMTPKLARAEAIHTPGPVFCAILQDIGWPLGDGCFALLSAELTAFEATRISGPRGIVELYWTTGPEAELDEFIIEQRFYDDAWEEIDRVNFIPGEREYSLRIEGLAPGRYSFRVRYLRDDGTSAFGPESEVTIPIEGEVAFTGPYPNPAHSRATVTVQVRRAQSVTAELFDMMGRRVDTIVRNRRVETADRLVLDVSVSSLSSGVYFLQINGTQFAETIPVVVVR